MKHGQKKNYYLDTEKFSTNAQIAKIGEYFANCIREKNLECDVVVRCDADGKSYLYDFVRIKKRRVARLSNDAVR